MNETLKAKTITLIKGMGIGTANVIPGVSGATIAVITGVFEQLIHAIKCCDITAAKLLFSGRFKECAKHIDFGFLAPLMLGVVIAIVSLARLLEFLFSHYPVYIWSYFFGLILASVYFVGKSVEKWTLLNSLLCLGGIAFAVTLTYTNPAVENRHVLYVFLCGIIAICSMILPGISGSFVLILMGNYELIVFEGISGFRLGLLVPFLLGCGIGLIGFSHILSWIMDRYRHQTIATLTGFITGSLLIIWPWKETIFKLNNLGKPLLKDGEPVVFKYLPILPDSFSSEVIIALAFMAVGIASICIMEYLAGSSNQPQKKNVISPKPQLETIEHGLLVRAPAKLNLSLLIAGKRDDGFHDIETIMVKVDFFDELLITESSEPGIHLTCSGPQWAPDGPDNLVYKAAKLICDVCDLKPSLELTLTKRIPAGTGLGSASSDAAAALIGINHFLDLDLPQKKLGNLAAQLGSDVSFFIYGPLSYCTGKGEIIDPLHTIFDFTAILILPDISISTPKAYGTYTHNPDIYTQLHQEINKYIKENRIDFAATLCANMLSDACFGLERGLAKAKESIEHLGIGRICLSGSGSAMYCIVDPALTGVQLDSIQHAIIQETGYSSIIVHSIRW